MSILTVHDDDGFMGRLLTEAMGFILDCSWEQDGDEMEDIVRDMTETELIGAVDRYWDGGWSDFVKMVGR